MIDLYAITPERSRQDIELGVRRALEARGSERLAILMRARQLPIAEQHALGRALRTLTRDRGARLFVSQDLELCARLGADGVQLPERGPSVAEARAVLGPERWIGASRHDAEGLTTAARQGATFATLSPVYDSPLKGSPLGAQTFAALVHRAELPVLALGGVELGHVRALITSGAAGIAVIRAVFDCEDPAAGVQAFLTEIDHARSLATTKPGDRGL